MARPQKFLLLGWVLLSLAACRTTGTITPGMGDVVPLNTAIRVQYQRPAYIRIEHVNSKNFQLTTCKKPTPPTEAENTDPKNTEDAESGKESTPKPKVTGGDAVPTRVILRQAVNRNTDAKISNIFIIPLASSVSDTPLQPGECYEVTTTAVQDEDGNSTDPLSDTFTATEDGQFKFAKEVEIKQWINPPSYDEVLPGNDIVYFEFAKPVLPQEVEDGFSLCLGDDEKDSSQRTNSEKLGKCRNRGYAVEANMVLAEPFLMDQDGYFTVSYTTYGFMLKNVEPGTYFGDVDLGKTGGHILNASLQDFRFTVEERLLDRDEKRQRVQDVLGEAFPAISGKDYQGWTLVSLADEKEER